MDSVGCSLPLGYHQKVKAKLLVFSCPYEESLSCFTINFHCFLPLF